MGVKYPITRKFAKSWQHHITRYAFALPYCYRKKVMDAGCQMGWGGQLLSYVANSVTYVDISEDWLGTAETLRNFCPADFILMDFEKDFPDKNIYKQDTDPQVPGWDTVVAFEVIEHLENPHVFLKGVSENLIPGGQLVFSVPDMVANHEHKHVYNSETIKSLIGQYFNIQEFYEQVRNPITEKPLYKNLKCYVGVAVCKK